MTTKCRQMPYQAYFLSESTPSHSRPDIIYSLLWRRKSNVLAVFSGFGIRKSTEVVFILVLPQVEIVPKSFLCALILLKNQRFLRSPFLVYKSFVFTCKRSYLQKVMHRAEWQIKKRRDFLYALFCHQNKLYN